LFATTPSLHGAAPCLTRERFSSKAGKKWGNIWCEKNPWLQLQAVKSVTMPIGANMARRVLGATSLLFLSRERNAFLFSHSDPVDANLQKTGAGSFGKKSILRTSARPAERECSAGCFL
jgi:hypothetical protein